MEDLGAGRELQRIIVRPVYLRAVNAIVQPEQQVPCTVYFFKEWLPRLGSLRWSLVLALRHLCTNRQADGMCRGEVSRSQLASLLGVHEVTISRVLTTTKSDTQPGWRVLSPSGEGDTETISLGRFIPRLRYKYERDPETGSTRRIGYIIDVIMDDPLVPEDEQRLAVVLAEQILAGMEEETPPLGPRNDQSAIPRMPISTTSDKYQNVSSHQGVKEHFATTDHRVSSHIATSPTNVIQHIVSSSQVKAQHEPGLTLTGNYNYHGITIPLKLKNKTSIRKAIAPLVAYATSLLQDEHSAGMYYATLTKLYPDHLEIFVEALEEAAERGDARPGLNMGAAFVNILKNKTAEAGLNLALGEKTKTTKTIESEPIEEEYESSEEKGESIQSCQRENVYIADIGMSSLQVWQSTLEELRYRTSRANFEMWLKNCHIIKLEAGTVIIGAPNKFTRDHVRDKLLSTIQESISRVIGQTVSIRCEIAGISDD